MIIATGLNNDDNNNYDVNNNCDVNDNYDVNNNFYRSCKQIS